uniref:Putative secreted protein n=1 Tax=Anopheles darlingi TaxID=43151 RepID=A0A2M4DMJ3_ANODA
MEMLWGGTSLFLFLAHAGIAQLRFLRHSWITFLALVTKFLQSLVLELIWNPFGNLVWRAPKAPSGGSSNSSLQ